MSSVCGSNCPGCEACPVPLREKLKALVGDLHEQAALYRRGQEISNSVQALAYTQCARKLSALLAESGPRCQIHPGCEQDCPKNCNCCTRKCEPGCAHCAQQEAKSKLPLGHRFSPCAEPTCKGCHYPVRHTIEGMADSPCGQPRSAHEPK